MNSDKETIDKMKYRPTFVYNINVNMNASIIIVPHQLILTWISLQNDTHYIYYI